MMQEQDWQSFQSEEKIPAIKSKRIWNSIYANTYAKKYWKQKALRISAVAALLFIVASVSLLLLWQEDAKPPQEVLLSLTNNSSHDVESYLPDSSKIRLFPHSSVKYIYHADKKEREVVLKGKAIFDVFKNKSEPFYVRTESIEVRAVGTIFLVEENAISKTVRVKLIEGKIIVKNIINKTNAKQNSVEEKLNAGESIAYTPTNITAPIIKERLAYTSEAIALDIHAKDFLKQFVEGNYLNFKNENLSQVFAVLGAVYQQDISYPKEGLEDFRLTASFKTSNSIDDILKTITKINHLKYKQQDQHVQIFF